MKINPQLLTDPALGAMLTATQPEAPATGQAAAPAVLRQQVELLNDANIRQLLDALGKTLGEMGKLGDALPPAVAKEAGKLGQAALGADTVLPQGLAATARGARSGGEALAAFAQTLADAAQLSEIFPRGLKPQTTAALAKFTAAISEGGDFATALQTLANKPASEPAPANMPAAAPSTAGKPAATPSTTGKPVATTEGQALPARLFPAGVTAETAAALETFARKISEGGDFAAKVLNMARQLVDSLKGGETLPQAARVLLAMLPAETPEAAAEFAQAATVLAKDIPERVRQAASFHNLPELEKALVRQKLADSLPWQKLPAETLRQASRTVRELAAAAPQPDQAAAETPAGQKVLVMTMPVYFADGKSYPAYLHISRDREQAGGGEAAAQRETWLRLCVATDNLGVVDMVFYLRGEQQLSIRVAFGNREAGEEFRRALPELREAMAASPLTLTDIAVVAAAEKP